MNISLNNMKVIYIYICNGGEEEEEVEIKV